MTLIVLQRNQFVNDRIWIIRYFQTHSQLSKPTIRDISFKTKLTSLVNTQVVTDSGSLKSDNNNDRKSGAMTDLKNCAWIQHCRQPVRSHVVVHWRRFLTWCNSQLDLRVSWSEMMSRYFRTYLYVTFGNSISIFAMMYQSFLST